MRKISGYHSEEGVIKPLTSKQRAELTARAHKLDPSVRVGSDGVTESVVASVQEAFNTRDVLKIKVIEGSPVSAREAAQDLVNRIEDVQLVRVIGRVSILYRSQRSGE